MKKKKLLVLYNKHEIVSTTTVKNSAKEMKDSLLEFMWSAVSSAVLDDLVEELVDLIYNKIHLETSEKGLEVIIRHALFKMLQRAGEDKNVQSK